MANTPPRRFIFHGSATPFGARILSIAGKPQFIPIEGSPCSSLGVVGGMHRAVSKGSSFQDIFNWGATVAESKGELNANGHHITTCTSSVENVSAKNDPHVFKASKVSITMVADHPQTGEGQIVPSAKPTFDGLELDGLPIEIEQDDDLIKFPTFEAFEKEYRRNQVFFAKYQVQLNQSAGAPKLGGRFPRTDGGYVLLSFVRSIRWGKKKYKGHILPLKGFGKIHFGEVLMKSGQRRVTLVRLAMGSNTSGEACVSCVDQNGTWT
jgi:hypothetical protein